MKKFISLTMVLLLICLDVVLLVYSYTAEGCSVDDHRAIGIITTVVVVMSLPLISSFIEKLKD